MRLNYLSKRNAMNYKSKMPLWQSCYCGINKYKKNYQNSNHSLSSSSKLNSLPFNILQNSQSKNHFNNNKLKIQRVNSTYIKSKFRAMRTRTKRKRRTRRRRIKIIFPIKTNTNLSNSENYQSMRGWRNNKPKNCIMKLINHL